MTRKERAQRRQAGDYKVPILTKPNRKKPIPKWTGGLSN
jgi:hypothetical protein